MTIAARKNCQINGGIITTTTVTIPSTAMIKSDTSPSPPADPSPTTTVEKKVKTMPATNEPIAVPTPSNSPPISNPT